MANIKIPAWDIAESLGLTYLGVHEQRDEWGDYNYMHEFDFHGKVISKHEGCYEGKGEAKERVAEDLLLEIGRSVAGLIKID